jgi:predicted AAA+ superfamily ATPase
MYVRDIEPLLKRFATIYPIIGITGPRQSGKTTIARLSFPQLPYISLENLDTRLRASRDPNAFLSHYTDGAIFDEIQHVPELLSYLQTMVDGDERRGRFVITGSQNFALSANISHWS